jgi:hypothetical protein
VAEQDERVVRMQLPENAVSVDERQMDQCNREQCNHTVTFIILPLLWLYRAFVSCVVSLLRNPSMEFSFCMDSFMICVASVELLSKTCVQY